MEVEEILLAFKNGHLSTTEVLVSLANRKLVQNTFGLSEMQKAIWAFQVANLDSCKYNLPMCFIVSQAIDIAKLNEAFLLIQKEFPIVTARYETNQGSLEQSTNRNGVGEVSYHDLPNRDYDQCINFIQTLCRKPFDLTNDTLVRIHLITSRENHFVLLVAHHIILDGTSLLKLALGLFDRYVKLCHDQQLFVRTPDRNFEGFVKWETMFIKSEAAIEDLVYWKEQLAAPLPRPFLGLPAENSLEEQIGFELLTFLIPERTSKNIRALSEDSGINLSTLFLTLYNILIFRYTKSEDQIVAFPISIRPDETYEGSIGLFINNVPIRSRILSDHQVLKLAASIQSTIDEALDRRFFPIRKAISEMMKTGDVEYGRIFNIGFAYQDMFARDNGPSFFNSIDGLNFNYLPSIGQENVTKLDFEIIDDGQHFVGRFKFSKEMFALNVGEKLAGVFLDLVDGLIAEPNSTIGKLNDRVKEDGDELRNDKSLFIDIFLNNVAKTPTAIAVKSGTSELTYQKLDELSSGIASNLQTETISRGQFVGVYLNKSIDAVATFLAILKLGAVYVPIDTSYPKDRIGYILRDSNVSAVITTLQLAASLPSRVKSTLYIDELNVWDEKIGIDFCVERLDPSDLAYVIYTSGSTGEPKGVMIEHKGIPNLISSQNLLLQVTPASKILQFASISFDASIAEFAVTLGCGGALIIPDANEMLAGEILLQELINSQITHVTLPPTVLASIPVTSLPNLAVLIVAGESCPQYLVDLWADEGRRLINAYGPSEYTVCATMSQPLRRNQKVNIGKAICDTHLYILDDNMLQVPAGTAGELYIGGVGVARGYLNKDEITRDRFIQNPFTSNPETIYKTGDIVKLNDDDDLEFLGRADSQIKIRGFRVELGEVETALRTIPTIQSCCVVESTGASAKQLFAYYTTTTGTTQFLTEDELRSRLSTILPSYMLPNRYIRLEEIPYSPNGKADRKKLQEMQTVGVENDLVKMGSILEQQVLKIWRDVLKEQIQSVDVGFFQAGGDSILAVDLANKIAKTFNTSFSVQDLFQHGSVSKIGRHLLSVSNEKVYHPKKNGLGESGRKIFQEVLPDYYSKCVAIIGVACTVPGAENHTEFWGNICNGVDSLSMYSREELRTLGVDENVIDNPNLRAVKSSIEGKSLFDAEFFSISPRDAELLDPQTRHLLMQCWRVLEDAGYTPDAIPDTGVFISTSNNLYHSQIQEGVKVIEGSDDYLTLLMAQGGITPTMISYKLGLHGPSLFVHSNCSSSLSALQVAFNSVVNGDCKQALVGASTLFSPTLAGYIYEKGMNFSDSGRCKVFDSTADGMVASEGVGVIAIKNALDAIKDGDNIYCLIRGIEINNDGADKVGFYAPSVNGQAKVVKRVFEKTKVNPETISYIECHGTGTKIGDPIEIKALNQAFSEFTSKKNFCRIGSVKANIGHLDTAAGIVGAIKVALSLKHATIPPSINYRTANENIDFKNSAFYVQEKLESIEQPGPPIRMGLSAFGIGGTNVHALFEQFPLTVISKLKDVKLSIIPISARTTDTLHEYARQILSHLRSCQQTPSAIKCVKKHIDIADLAYTFQLGRLQMASRVSFVVKDMADLINKLEIFTRLEPLAEGTYTNAGITDSTSTLLDNDEDLEILTTRWIATNRLDKIAKLWVEGKPINWRLLNSEGQCKRITLPSYPFVKKHYWLPSVKSDVNRSNVSLEKRTPIISNDVKFFEEYWLELPKSTPLTQPTTITILCFIDASREGSFRQAWNKDQKGVLITVSPGKTTSPIDDSSITIDTDAPNCYFDVLGEIESQRDSIGAIVYNMRVIENESRTANLEEIIRILKAIEVSKISIKTFLIVCEINETLESCFMDSLIGFVRSVNRLNKTYSMSILYEEPHKSHTETIQNVIRQLSDNYQCKLYKDGLSWVPAFREIALKKSTSSIRHNGTYIITGGAGGIGSRVSLYLSSKYHCNLVIIGRSEIDDAKTSFFKTLDQQGGKTLYLKLDICDEFALKVGIERAIALFGGIDGVIHAAGLESAVNIFNKDFEEFNKILEPKVYGALLLDKLLRTQALDFVCYFSSLSASLGDFGNCDYAFANRFLQAFGKFKNSKEKSDPDFRRTIVINWPQWREGRMGQTRQDEIEMYLKITDQSFLETAEGIDIFESALSSNFPIVNVVKATSPKSYEIFNQRPVSKPLVPLTRLDKDPLVRNEPEIPSAHSPAYLSTLLEGDLKLATHKILKVEPSEINMDLNLVDLGYDSISLVKLASLISKSYLLEISPSIFFTHSTLRQIQDFLISNSELLKIPKPSTVEVTEISSKATPVIPSNELSSIEPIAIIGVSGKFPDANNLDELWDILANAREATTFLTAENSAPRKITINNETNVSNISCGLIPGVADFDPLFFEISPLEAQTMDPRQRHLLQEAWKALEDAAIVPNQIKNTKVGVFVGVEQGDYQMICPPDTLITANHDGILAARLSYFLNLHGPVISINTACSSGLVALHQACVSLRNSECDTAIAAGVNIICTPNSFDGMTKAGMLSPDGKCFAFDDRANGIVPGEAVVAIVLKRLSMAEEDGDPIHCIIKGSGINFDGRTNGITAPSGSAQTKLYNDVYEKFSIAAETIDCLITHGTGTKLGDPVEVNALTEAFRTSTSSQHSCALISVKPNLGHSLAASGLVNLASLMQAMKNKTLPPSINLENENKYIDRQHSPFYINKEKKDWPQSPEKRMTGAVSAFGMSGTNAHVVVEDYHRKVNKWNDKLINNVHVFVLSAKTKNSLRLKVKDLSSFLAKSESTLEDIAYTLQVAREHFEIRMAVISNTKTDLIKKLNEFLELEMSEDMFRSFQKPDRKTLELYNRQLDLVFRNESNIQSKNTLREIAELYCQGVKIPWIKLHHNTQNKVHLPTYPFDTEYCWVSDHGLKSVSPNPKIKGEIIETINGRFPGPQSDAQAHTEILSRSYAFIDLMVEFLRNATPRNSQNHRHELSKIQWSEPSLYIGDMEYKANILIDNSCANAFEISRGHEDQDQEVLCQGLIRRLEGDFAKNIKIQKLIGGQSFEQRYYDHVKNCFLESPSNHSIMVYSAPNTLVFDLEKLTEKSISAALILGTQVVEKLIDERTVCPLSMKEIIFSLQAYQPRWLNIEYRQEDSDVWNVCVTLYDSSGLVLVTVDDLKLTLN